MPPHDSQLFHRRVLYITTSVLFLWSLAPPLAAGQDTAQEATGASAAQAQFDIGEMFKAGGVVGLIIIAMSVFMVALIVEHAISIRRGALMPQGLADEVHQLLSQLQFAQATEHCRARSSFLGNMLGAGLSEIGLAYSSIEKAMEDRAAAQAARLFRKIDYLQIIGTLAPMLGLLGTVWGMIQAFLQFEAKANPQVAELAPGIYKALVTTLIGLSVAVPALASFAIYRNRIDELVAEASQLAEHVFADYKRALITQKKSARRGTRGGDAESGEAGQGPTA
jgi:biopolymer transport protein ExbB